MWNGTQHSYSITHLAQIAISNLFAYLLYLCTVKYYVYNTSAVTLNDFIISMVHQILEALIHIEQWQYIAYGLSV